MDLTPQGALADLARTVRAQLRGTRRLTREQMKSVFGLRRRPPLVSDALSHFPALGFLVSTRRASQAFPPKVRVAGVMYSDYVTF